MDIGIVEVALEESLMGRTGLGGMMRGSEGGSCGEGVDKGKGK